MCREGVGSYWTCSVPFSEAVKQIST